MCGRYYRRSDRQRTTDAFKGRKLPPNFELPPDFNIAPKTLELIIRPDTATDGQMSNPGDR
jgi:putative SOS response-associated peptidase YedK